MHFAVPHGNGFCALEDKGPVENYSVVVRWPEIV
jgi:hypothetical protein